MPDHSIPTRVAVEARRALTQPGNSRTARAAARRLAAGGAIGDDFLASATAYTPGPITQRWLSTLSESKAAVDYSDGIMVALMIPESLAETIAVPDGQPFNELHITLAFLGNTEGINDDSDYLIRLLQAVRDVASQHGPLSGKLSGTGRFIGDQGQPDVYYASADIPGLEDVRYELVEALGEVEIKSDTEHGFTPHVTLAYLPSNATLPEGRWTPRPVEFEAISVVYGTNVIPVPLGADDNSADSAAQSRSDPLPTTTSATVNAAGPESKLYNPTERARRRAEVRAGGAR